MTDCITDLCIKAEEETPCTLCGGCEERTFACSEDYYDALIEKQMEKDEYDSY